MTKKNETFDRVSMVVLIFVLFLVAAGLAFSSFKSCDIKIDYDVTVDEDS